MLLKSDYSDEEYVFLKEKILKLNISAKIRRDLISNLKNQNLAYEWAIADFIHKSYRCDNIFAGTQNGQWSTFEQLSQIMLHNIADEFEGFHKSEMLKILYYICRIQHELYPQNNIIEELRVDYLKREMVR